MSSVPTESLLSVCILYPIMWTYNQPQLFFTFYKFISSSSLTIIATYKYKWIKVQPAESIQDYLYYVSWAGHLVLDNQSEYLSLGKIGLFTTLAVVDYL